MKPRLSFKSTALRILLMIAVAYLFGGIYISIEMLRSPTASWKGMQQAFVLLGFYSVCMVVTNVVAFSLSFRNYTRPGLSGQVVLRALASFLVSALVATWTGGHLIRWFYPEMDVLNIRQYVLMSFYTLTFGIPMFLYFFVKELWEKALEKVKEKEVAQERLEKELLAARLKALQSQTNPHFLFNTLNSIASLISIDPVRAETTVEKLAGLFRYALDSHEGTSVRLEEEIRVVEDYLAIERVRFGPRLNYQVTVDEGLLECPVPPLILQPLVENAVKHGTSSREEDSHLKVGVTRAKDGKVRFVVENDGPPLSASSSGEGVGLANLHSRCRALFNEDYVFKLWQPRSGVTRAELEIPLLGRRLPEKDPRRG